MRTILCGLLAVASVAIATPASAQLFIETPVGGVLVGPEQHYDRGRDYGRSREGYGRSRHDGTVGYNERSSDRECRTITIQRDNGTVRRIRRCD